MKRVDSRSRDSSRSEQSRVSRSKTRDSDRDEENQVVAREKRSLSSEPFSPAIVTIILIVAVVIALAFIFFRVRLNRRHRRPENFVDIYFLYFYTLSSSRGDVCMLPIKFLFLRAIFLVASFPFQVFFIPTYRS